MGFLGTVNEGAVNLDFFDNQAAALHLHNAMRACCGCLTRRQERRPLRAAVLDECQPFGIPFFDLNDLAQIQMDIGVA